jgi:hypothetical protein
MFVLVVVACLQGDPSVCTTRTLGVVPDRSAASCQVNSRPRVQAWDRAEPREVARGWSCRPQAGEAG